MIRDELNLNPEHRPHDGRKHFVTMAKKYGVDEYAIKYMVGHKISDITEKVYTQREFEWLKDEIENKEKPPRSGSTNKGTQHNEEADFV